MHFSLAVIFNWYVKLEKIKLNLTETESEIASELYGISESYKSIMELRNKMYPRKNTPQNTIATLISNWLKIFSKFDSKN